jgi:hypothetical protein
VVVVKRLIAGLCVVLSAMLLGSPSSPGHPVGTSGPSSLRGDAQVQDNIDRTFGQLSMSFEPNSGQADPRTKFLSHGKGSTVFLTSAGVSLALALASTSPGRAPAQVAGLKMTFLGANADPVIEGANRVPGLSNYFLGNDPARWRTGVPHYATAIYRDLYPGIDLSFFGNQEGHLEYDFTVAPGTDPSIIQLAMRGQEAMTVDSTGDLIVRLDGREIRQPRPQIYQYFGGSRQAIVGSYVLNVNHVGFSVGAFDRTRPLVIDPEIVYSTYLGGSGDDLGEIHPAVDGSGHVFICGITDSVDFPTSPGVVQPTLPGSFDGFVTEMSADGSGVVYSTFLGGTGLDDAQACQVDGQGNVYVGGFTASADFPVTPGAFQPTLKGGNDGYVAKLSPDGSTLIYSTFLGGSGDENLNSLQIDAAGNAFVAGDTFSVDFPTTPRAYQPSNAGGQGTQCPHHGLACNDEFVAKLNPTGSGLLYSTYLGGKGADCCQPGLAIDGKGNAYIEGTTSSHGFPTTVGALQRSFAGSLTDLFVTKLNPTGSSLAYSTYLGSSGLDLGSLGIAVDAFGNAYVAGLTCSKNFPVTPGAFQMTYAGPDSFVLCGDDFVSKINSRGSALVYSTYLGGSTSWETPSNGVLVDAAGHAFVTGISLSTDFPVTPDAFQPTNHGGWDGTLTELTADGSGLLFSSYLGGGANDGINGAALDPAGNLYATGCTESRDFPTTAGAFQTSFQGGDASLGFFICGGATDAFVTKIAFGD